MGTLRSVGLVLGILTKVLALFICLGVLVLGAVSLFVAVANHWQAPANFEKYFGITLEDDHLPTGDTRLVVAEKLLALKQELKTLETQRQAREQEIEAQPVTTPAEVVYRAELLRGNQAEAEKLELRRNALAHACYAAVLGGYKEEAKSCGCP